jgi:plasmid stabilization system protein ParE
MTSHIRVLPAADRDLDGQAAYLLQEANPEAVAASHSEVP